MSGEPTRIVDLMDRASPEEKFMRAVIRGERTELPSEEKMQELAARLGPIATKGGAATRLALGWRWLVVVALAGTFAAGTLSLGLRPDAGGQPSAVPAAPRLVGEPAVEPSPGTGALPSSREPAAPTIPVESLPPASATPRARSAASAAAPVCVGEIELVDRADATLRSGDANRALEITRMHATRCPDGAFVQERERIAIEALARLGRNDEVRMRARVFESRFPTSPHIRRIRSLAERSSE